MIVTSKWIHENSTSNLTGSWNNAQLSAIGCTDKRSGWISRLEGIEITEEQRLEFEYYAHWNKGQEGFF